MFIKQFYTNCLSEAAYYIESNGQAAVIDPLRDVSPYIQLAEERGATIQFVFETHFHADFVSGHLELARKTGADIIYGSGAQADYEITVAEDNAVFTLGDVQLKVLHTPGHTMESSCIMLMDEVGTEHALFTGDTLFIGDVGRPDLAVNASLSQEDLAGFLYDSIYEKILPLGDDLIIYPGHGKGSKCGKKLSDKKWSTLGAERKSNYALQGLSKPEFIQTVTEGLSTPPQYFPKNAQLNKAGYISLDQVLNNAYRPLSAQDFAETLLQQNALVLDCRASSNWAAGYVRGSLHVGMDGSFAVWVGTLVKDINQPLLLITEPEMEREAIIRLARVGYDNVLGFLKGGMDTWMKAGKKVDRVKCICPNAFLNLAYEGQILDVRRPDEVASGALPSAINIPLEELYARLIALDKEAPVYVYCRSGYRSAVAASILKQQGFESVVNIKKGYQGLSQPSKACTCA